MESVILTSKITPPAPRENFISREALKARLSDFLSPFPSLILVIAPTGYGKTTLVSSLISGIPGCAWLTLGSADAVFMSFIRYLNAAVRRVFPAFGDFINAVSASPINRPPEYFAEIFAFEIEKLDEGLVLVLDNYHEISDPKTLEFVSRLLDNMPLNLGLIILTQEDPSFSVPRRRLSQRINELRGTDLAFSAEEIRETLSREKAVSLPKEYLNKIELKTEGWPAAVALCALALSGLTPDEQLKAVDDSLNSYRYIIDYFADWLVADIDQNTLDFITDTAVLDSFSPGLSDFVCKRTDSTEIIGRLKKKHIPFFIQESDRQWYRYHRLFSEYVKSRYRNTKMPEICRLASLWFEEMGGAVQTSLRYAVLSGDSTRIEELLVRKSEDLFVTGKFEIARKLLGELNGAVYYNPSVRRIRLWGDFLSGNTPGSDQFGDDETDPALLCLRAWADKRLGPGAAEQLAERSFLQLRNSRSFFAYMAALIYAKILTDSGNHQKAVELLKRTEAELLPAEHPFLYSLLNNYLMKALSASGRLDQALKTAEGFLSSGTGPDYRIPEDGFVLSEMAIICRKKGDMIRAAEYADEALSLLSLMKTENFIPDEDLELLNTIKNGIIKLEGNARQLNVEKLSRRENEILALLEKGCSNREIGELLFISTGTVKWHLNNIFGKLNVSSRMQAILRETHFQTGKTQP